MLKGTTHTPATRAKLSAIGRAKAARRRARNRIAPSEVLEVERNGTISPTLRPYARQAAQVPHDVALDLGGADSCSAQVRVLLADLGRSDLVLRVLVARFLQGEGDPELATKIGTLIGQRRQQLVAVGLERRTREMDLSAYLASKRDAPGVDAPRANGSSRDAQPAEAEIDAQSATAVTG